MRDQTIPVGLCQCGCGERTPLAKTTKRAAGLIKGQPRRFLQGHGTRDPSLPWWLPEDRGYTTPCHIWQGSLSKGYGCRKLSWLDDDMAHRQAWIDAYGPIPDGLWVLHHCDQPPCINAEHLFLGTPAINSADMTAKGRFPTGERHWQAKFTAAQVTEIRTLLAAGRRQADIAQTFGVSNSVISNISTGRTWRGVG